MTMDAVQQQDIFLFQRTYRSNKMVYTVGFQSLHIISRYESYSLNLTPEKEKEFLDTLENNLHFLIETLTIFCREILLEGENLGILCQRDTNQSGFVSFEIPYQKNASL